MEWGRPTLFLLLLLSANFAEFPGDAAAFTICLPAAIMISVAIIGLVHMLAQFLRIPALDAWTKVELAELAISVILVVLIAAAAAGADAFVGIIAGQPGAGYDSLLDAANNYLDVMRGDLQAEYVHSARVLYDLNKAAGFTYSMSLSAYFVSGTSSIAPRSGLGPLVVGMMGAMGSLANTALLIEAQRMFLEFFTIVIPRFLLPAAVVLRTFSFTRKLGSTLIAVSIGGWLVFPAATIFSGEIYQQVKDNSGAWPDLGWSVPDIGEPAPDAICTLWVQAPLQRFVMVGEQKWADLICTGTGPFAPFCRVAVIALYLGIIGGATLAFSQHLRSYVGGYEVSEFFNPLFSQGLPAISGLVVFDLALAIATMLITLSSIRSISGAIGGEVQLYGLTKII